MCAGCRRGRKQCRGSWVLGPGKRSHLQPGCRLRHAHRELAVHTVQGAGRWADLEEERRLTTRSQSWSASIILTLATICIVATQAPSSMHSMAACEGG